MANSGIEAQTEENTETVRSIQLRSRMPASTPSSTENGTMTAKQTPASISVLPSRSHSTSETGLRKTMDWPKSPRAALAMYSR